MDLFDKNSTDWETVEQEIEKAIKLIQELRTEKKSLVEENNKLKEDTITFRKTEKELERRIKELIKKVNAIGE
ncbi:MAG: hypothetical protein E3J78_00015 [Candidatus Cloacimonadota bacterium]|nr:MAG: hypothetical protein E3J78_00015 [Candidatus Cloacimonadota bacterium]